ncbi:TPA: polysaccharide deacetylase family protein [Klebsiella pneumoniae]|nr:polysaccharide deacetylase family protein [Klebsiella pneumoniae]
MSVPNQIPYNIYTANGQTTVFTYEFYIISASDLEVSINGSVVTSGYTVSGVGNKDGGDITFLTPPGNGAVVMLERAVPTYRLTDYQDNGDLLADTVNKDFDRIWMAIQRAFIDLGLTLNRPLLGGPFNALNYQIINVSDPVNDEDAANKRFVVSSINVGMSTVLRTPDAIPKLPGVSARRKKTVGFDESGMPTLLDPSSTGMWGYVPVNGSFEKGGQVNERFEVFLWESTNEYYRWDGVLPKSVAANSTPHSSGGVSVGAWVDVTDATLRAQLLNQTARVGELDARLITGDVTRSGAFISFTFDDAYISALDVAAAFESRGLKTSFAFGMITPSRTATRLTWADVRDLAERGHEICNQGLTDSAIFSDAYNRALVNAEINQAYDMLREVGVECSGYHASRNSLGASFTDLLAENHAYAFTVANQTAEGAAALQTYPINPYRMFRVSLFSLGLTKAKAAVDAAIANSGYVAFYDHDPSQQYYATSMSLADLNSLLDYCISKGVTVLPPAQVMTWLSGNLTQGRDVLTAVSQRKTDVYVNPNLLPQYDLSRMGSDGDGSGETYVEKTTSAGSITISATISADTINGASITIGNDITADGSVYIRPSGVGVIVSNGPDARLVDSRQAFCFSCGLYSGSAAANTNFRITLGVDVINSSTGEIIETLESDAVQLDNYARLFSLPFARSNFDVAAYLKPFIRIEVLTAGSAVAIGIRNLKIEHGSKPTPWVHGRSHDSIEEPSAAGYYLDSKELASGSDVLMTCAGGLGNTSYCKLADGLIQFTKTDTYSVQIHGYVNLASPVTDGFRTEVRVDGTNGIAFAPTLTPIVGGLCIWKWSGTVKKAAGQKLSIYFRQNTGQPVTTVAGGELSYVRIQPC